MISKVLAQAGVGTTAVNPLNTTFGGNAAQLSSIFGLIINVIIGVGIALTIIFLALGGIQYVTSKGDPKQKELAQQALTNAIIGLVVVLGAVTIRYVIGNLLGADTSGAGNLNIVTPFGQ